MTSGGTNISGSQDYTLPDGQRVTSQPNIFGGTDYRGNDIMVPMLPDERDPGVHEHAP